MGGTCSQNVRMNVNEICISERMQHAHKKENKWKWDGTSNKSKIILRRRNLTGIPTGKRPLGKPRLYFHDLFLNQEVLHRWWPIF